jgi:hypothetical protein
MGKNGAFYEQSPESDVAVLGLRRTADVEHIAEQATLG